jgi:hypothetical protein
MYNEKDTGIRGTFSGRLYIDKAVFFKRPEVQKELDRVRIYINSLKKTSTKKN